MSVHDPSGLQVQSSRNCCSGMFSVCGEKVVLHRTVVKGLYLS